MMNRLRAFLRVTSVMELSEKLKGKNPRVRLAERISDLEDELEYSGEDMVEQVSDSRTIEES